MTAIVLLFAVTVVAILSGLTALYVAEVRRLKAQIEAVRKCNAAIQDIRRNTFRCLVGGKQ